MKTINNAENTGTIPLRASKNAVLGVFRHHCGSIASVHQPKGRRKNTRYLICDNCGTDQAGGAAYQEKIRLGTFDTIELLEQAESQAENEPLNEPLQTAPAVAYTEIEQVEPAQAQSEPVLTESQAEKQAESEPKPAPAQTAHDAVYTENEPTSFDTDKIKKVGLAAIIGGLFGLILAR